MEGKQTKLYTIEVVEGDEIFTGTDIPADSQEEAMNTMMFMFMGLLPFPHFQNTEKQSPGICTPRRGIYRKMNTIIKLYR